MSALLHALLLSAVAIVTGPTSWGQTMVNFDFGAVRIACSNGYAYEGPVLSCPYAGPSQNFNGSPGFGWILGTVLAGCCRPQMTLDGGPGLSGPDTIFFPPPFDGLPFNQAVILQDAYPFVWQAVRLKGLSAAALSFKNWRRGR